MMLAWGATPLMVEVTENSCSVPFALYAVASTWLPAVGAGGVAAVAVVVVDVVERGRRRRGLEVPVADQLVVAAPVRRRSAVLAGSHMPR